MPASPQSSGTASHRNILLLEEYDALAAAIGSALKKFAPQHTVSVARSLGEAEKLAAKTHPELFVIDVDPPWLGLTEFLEKIQTAHPNARALIIGESIPAEIATERGYFGALQFIGKPFELAAFGAAVQALLGPWREAESAVPRGSLSALNPVDVMLLHCASGASVIVELRANDKRSGKIHIREGNISHAETGALTGIEALREILGWSDARIIRTNATVSVQQTIHRNWVPVLVEALRDAKARQLPKISPATEVPAQKPRPKTGKKIVVIDDTEMLLIFVEDVLATADPELQITTASTGIDGIKETKRVGPDLVLLDYSLPDMNGDEVCQRLLQNERTARLPVLLMSGHVAKMEATAKRFANVVATIEKPFLSDALVQLVQKTLTAGPRKPEPVAKSVPAPAAKPVAPIKPASKMVENRQPPTPSFPVDAPLTPGIFEPSQATAAPPRVRAVAGEANDAVLGLFLEVISMQLTPHLRMGPIRARPASFTVSLQLPSAVRNALDAEVGFQLGATEVDQSGRISTLRLIPTRKPFRPTETQNAFQIGRVAVIPDEPRARVQLTPAGTTPMTMRLVANLELDTVELSPTFQVAQLVLKWRTNAVRVAVSSKTTEQDGVFFEATSVVLDGSSKIAELLLNPSR